MQYHCCSGESHFLLLCLHPTAGRLPFKHPFSFPPSPCATNSKQKQSNLSPHLPFRIISCFSPGTSFCNALAVSHASHRSRFPPGRLMHRSPPVEPACFVSASLHARRSVRCLRGAACENVCRFLHVSARSFCLMVEVHRQLVIPRSGCKAVEINSTDVTSPPGCVLTENTTTISLRECQQ